MGILLKNVAIDGAHGVDVLVDGETVAALGTDLQRPGAERVECGGALLLPSFIDAHVHLDKTRFGTPRLHHPVTASVAERAARERRLRIELEHDPFAGGERLARQLTVMGTTHVRSHVDIDPDVGLRHVEAMLRLREHCRGWLDIELVAFPQSGIVRSPGVAELMGEALRMGVDLVGGLDPEVVDGDRAGHLDAVFGLAERSAAGIDIHLHEPGATGLASIRAIAERVQAHGLTDRVTISHAYALGQVEPRELADVLPRLARLGVRIVTSAPGAVNFPPVDALLDAGVIYAAASDNIQDLWSPWGNGDLLERAMLLAYRSGYRADEPLRRCLAMVTDQPARLMKLATPAVAPIAVGSPANFTAVPAEDVETAILQRPLRLFTMKAGRFTARDGVALAP